MRMLPIFKTKLNFIFYFDPAKLASEIFFKKIIHLQDSEASLDRR